MSDVRETQANTARHPRELEEKIESARRQDNNNSSYSFSQSFTQHLFIAHSVRGTNQGPGETAVYKADKTAASWCLFSRGENTNMCVK